MPPLLRPVPSSEVSHASMYAPFLIPGRPLPIRSCLLPAPVRSGLVSEIVRIILGLTESGLQWRWRPWLPRVRCPLPTYPQRSDFPPGPSVTAFSLPPKEECRSPPTPGPAAAFPPSCRMRRTVAVFGHLLSGPTGGKRQSARHEFFLYPLVRTTQTVLPSNGRSSTANDIDRCCT